MLVEIGTTRSVQSYIQQAPFMRMSACACAGSLLIPKSHWQCELPGQSSSRIASCPANPQVALQVAPPICKLHGKLLVQFGKLHIKLPGKLPCV
jgi:hypothetical protein